jgi:hypothetical protein
LMAPSQFSAAVAGVQLALRQHSSFVPFFHTVPSAARQLSTDFWANALDIGAASAADAKSNATLFSFFMILLSRKAAVACDTSISEVDFQGKHPLIAGAYHRQLIVPWSVGWTAFSAGATKEARTLLR